MLINPYSICLVNADKQLCIKVIMKSFSSQPSKQFYDEGEIYIFINGAKTTRHVGGSSTISVLVPWKREYIVFTGDFDGNFEEKSNWLLFSNFGQINNTRDRSVCDLFGYYHIVIPSVGILPYI